MNLSQPIIGTDSGLTWEQSANANADVVDQHNHTAGQGVQIPSSGINIDVALPFNNQQATDLQAVQFTAQASLATLRALYFIGVDLYANDGAGNVVKITSGGAVNATSSGISSGTATASFVSSVLVVNSNVNTPANIQVASVLLGNNVANSKYLTLQPPNAMAADYSLTLPALPLATKILALDTSGNILANVDGDGTTIQFSGTTISVVALGIGTAQLAALSVTTAKIADGAVTLSKLATSVLQLNVTTITSSGTFVVPAGVKEIYAEVAGAGGGGGGGRSSGGGASAAGGGGGGAGALPNYRTLAVTPAETLTITIGAGGTAGANGGSPTAGGQGGTSSILRSATTLIAGLGGLGGTQGTNTVGGTGGGNVTPVTNVVGAAGIVYTAQVGFAGQSGGNGGASPSLGGGAGGAGSSGSGFYQYGFSGGAAGATGGGVRGGGGGGGSSAYANGGGGGTGGSNAGGAVGTLCSGGGGGGADGVGFAGGAGQIIIRWYGTP